MTAASFALVPFHDHQVLAGSVGDTVFVPLKRFCATIGLPWAPQHARIHRDEILAEGIFIMKIPSDGGDQEQVCLPLDLIPGFLFGAEAKRYAPELRERVQLFRARCYRALYDHFFGRGGRAPAVATSRRDMLGVYDRLKRATAPAERRFLYAMLEQDSAQFQLPLPLLDEIGAAAPAPIDLVARFLGGLDTLTGLGVAWEQSRTETFSACRPRQVAAAFRDNDLDVRVDPALQAAARLPGSGIEKKNVNSATGIHHCWVFARRPALLECAA